MQNASSNCDKHIYGPHGRNIKKLGPKATCAVLGPGDVIGKSLVLCEGIIGYIYLYNWREVT